MEKEIFSFRTGAEQISDIEEYIEGLFKRWNLNEIYMGNINTCFSNLAGLLSASPQSRKVNLETWLEGEKLRIKVFGLESSILKFFSSRHRVEEVKDNTIKSVFLIQQICDEVRAKGKILILTFHISALPEAIYLNRVNTVNKTLKNAKNILND